MRRPRCRIRCRLLRRLRAGYDAPEVANGALIGVTNYGTHRLETTNEFPFPHDKELFDKMTNSPSEASVALITGSGRPRVGFEIAKFLAEQNLPDNLNINALGRVDHTRVLSELQNADVFCGR